MMQIDDSIDNCIKSYAVGSVLQLVGSIPTRSICNQIL